MKKILNLCLGLTLGLCGASKVLSTKVPYYSFTSFDNFLGKIDQIFNKTTSINLQLALEKLQNHRYCRDLFNDIEAPYNERYLRYVNRKNDSRKKFISQNITSRKEFEDFLSAEMDEEKENEKKYAFFSLSGEVTLSRTCLFLFSEKRDFSHFDLKPLFVKAFYEDKQKINFMSREEYFAHIRNQYREEVKQSFIQQRLEQITFLLKEFTEGLYSTLSYGQSYAPFSFFGDSNCYTEAELWEIKPLFDSTVNEEKDYDLTHIENELASLDESQRIISLFFPRIVGDLAERHKNNDINSGFKIEKDDIQENIDFIKENFPQEENLKITNLITFLTNFSQDRLSDEEISKEFEIIEKNLDNEDVFFKIRKSLLTLKKDLIERNEAIIAVIEEEVDEFFDKAEAFFLAR